MSASPWQAELALACRAASAAADVLRQAGRGPREVRHKGAVDLVTEVDLAAEQAVCSVLQDARPDTPILAEEGGGAWNASTRWIVDPLDGTTNFVHGFPYYCVSIALQVDDDLVVAVIADPIRAAQYTATRGGGAWCGERRLSVSTRSDLSRALLGTGFPYDRHSHARRYLPYVEAFLTRGQGLRRAGAAALDLAMVACGALDGFWEFNLQPWDIAAGHLLIEEAGGTISAHDGSPLNLLHPSPLATNGLLHEAMRDVLAEVRDAS